MGNGQNAMDVGREGPFERDRQPDLGIYLSNCLPDYLPTSGTQHHAICEPFPLTVRTTACPRTHRSSRVSLPSLSLSLRTPHRDHRGLSTHCNLELEGTRNPAVPSSPAAVTADVQREMKRSDRQCLGERSERAASLLASLSRGRRDEAGPGPATGRYKALEGAKNRSGGACEVGSFRRRRMGRGRNGGRGRSAVVLVGV
jgi:hypothetical protein